MYELIGITAITRMIFFKKIKLRRYTLLYFKVYSVIVIKGKELMEGLNSLRTSYIQGKYCIPEQLFPA